MSFSTANSDGIIDKSRGSIFEMLPLLCFVGTPYHPTKRKQKDFGSHLGIEVFFLLCRLDDERLGFSEREFEIRGAKRIPRQTNQLSGAIRIALHGEPSAPDKLSGAAFKK